jgi:transposase
VDAQKKTPVAREQDRPAVKQQRVAFAEMQPTMNAAKLVFIDESGFRLGSPPTHGWAPVGQKSFGKVTQGAWRTMTMMGALALDGWRGFLTINAPTDGDIFWAFVTQELIPNLRPGDSVVMDNLAAHKRPDIIAAIRRAGVEVLFLPPYSPDFNPIEKAWAKLKQIIRRLTTLTREAFDHAVASAMTQISTDDIKAWSAYAGYTITPT